MPAATPACNAEPWLVTAVEAAAARAPARSRRSAAAWQLSWQAHTASTTAASTTIGEETLGRELLRCTAPITAGIPRT